MATRFDMKDKYGNDYIVSIDFTTHGQMPKEMEETTINFGISIQDAKNNKLIEKYYTNTSSAVLKLIGKDKFMKELDVTRRINRHGDRLQGKNMTEIKIDFKSHFDDMLQGLVDDFIKQFDALPYDDRKQMLIDAMDDLEVNKQSSFGVIGKIFENCTQIDNFLALDSTGSLRSLMEEKLMNALDKDRVDIDRLFQGITNVPPTREYDRDEDEYGRY